MGTFTITGNEDNPRLTISTKLDDEPFPNDLGDEVKVDLVEPEDEEPFLEVHPADE